MKLEEQKADGGKQQTKLESFQTIKNKQPWN